MAMQNNRRGAVKRLRLLTYSLKTNVDTFSSKMDREFETMFLPNKVELSEYKYGNTD